MEIIISKFLSSKSAVFHDEGLHLYDLIDPEISKGREVVLSFEGLVNCSTQFLNACLGKLYVNHSIDKIDRLLTLEGQENIPLLPKKIDDVIENAKNSEYYDKVINAAIA